MPGVTPVVEHWLEREHSSMGPPQSKKSIRGHMRPLSERSTSEPPPAPPPPLPTPVICNTPTQQWLGEDD